jgi:hypothetical protein
LSIGQGLAFNPVRNGAARDQQARSDSHGGQFALADQASDRAGADAAKLPRGFLKAPQQGIAHSITSPVLMKSRARGAVFCSISGRSS